MHNLPDSFTFHFQQLQQQKAKGKKATNFVDWAKNIIEMCSFDTVEDFWALYQHIIKPNFADKASQSLMLFRSHIKPLWEDPANANGGRFHIHLKKGFASLFWEEFILAFIGNQFTDEQGSLNGQISGAIISIRPADDILYVWTQCSDTARVTRLREMLGRVFNLQDRNNGVMDFKAFGTHPIKAV
ncbi:Translation Initiation factor eIF- 4e [Carpediemonas membranifera]|uniref:Translation Initiation factor eIF- 4e n=1 Tax=Carpediemonas membranifera TaxID=201153 RepID=A0A8J6E314_9EUKA|nr:Translation Initiation factor eIF- 4e [Carpediemonas membranifera]|eukprot:KAG9392572.1 Translation Initiation factor eIF- 4e [Carpediemonas membranifera]